MSQSDPPIIISGGSVTIEFDPSTFTPNGNGKHSNANKKIKRVEITGDGIDPIDLNVPNGKVTVKVHYSNP
ncbi:MAG TPA: hypothetical protein VN282_01760 [Pyrinomonadaceae bacterium]|nr:hypothetical protein [Pyrinomonadaceae bacterium]